MRTPSATRSTTVTSSRTRAGAVALLSLASLALAIPGCGSTESTPDDVTVLKLKTPMELSAMPVTGGLFLRWFANNNEKDFSGFNVYVSSASREEIVKAFGLDQVDDYDPHVFSPIRFRDDQEEAIASVRSNLSKYFNWDKATKTIKPGGGEDFAPVARCNVVKNDAGGECKAVTGDSQDNRANGVIEYPFPEGVLSKDKEYAVFVASTRDDGEEIGTVTSNVVFVRPHELLKLPEELGFKNSGSTADGVDLSGEKPTLRKGTFKVETQYCLANEDTAEAKSIDAYFEVINAGTANESRYVTPANGARIADLGNVVGKDGAILTGADVIEGTERPDSQVLVPGIETATPSSEKPAAGDIGADVGYSRCGQSQKLIPGHLYSIAFPDGKGGWRYALLKAPDTGTELSDSSKYLLVVGREGERRL